MVVVGNHEFLSGQTNTNVLTGTPVMSAHNVLWLPRLRASSPTQPAETKSKQGHTPLKMQSCLTQGRKADRRQSRWWGMKLLERQRQLCRSDMGANSYECTNTAMLTREWLWVCEQDGLMSRISWPARSQHKDVNSSPVTQRGAVDRDWLSPLISTVMRAFIALTSPDVSLDCVLNAECRMCNEPVFSPLLISLLLHLFACNRWKGNVHPQRSNYRGSKSIARAVHSVKSHVKRAGKPIVWLILPVETLATWQS